MMKDDVSAIPTTGCNIISSPDHIRNYTADRYTYSDYYLMGDTWVKADQYTSSRQYDISTYQCINPQDLHSQYSYMYPIYETINFVLVGALFVFFFWLIFKPLIWGSNG